MHLPQCCQVVHGGVEFAHFLYTSLAPIFIMCSLVQALDWPLQSSLMQSAHPVSFSFLLLVPNPTRLQRRFDNSSIPFHSTPSVRLPGVLPVTA